MDLGRIDSLSQYILDNISENIPSIRNPMPLVYNLG